MQVDLVLVQMEDGVFLYEAPTWPHLDIGRSVIVESGLEGKVIAVETYVDTDSEHYNFVKMTAFGNLKPLQRVKGYITVTEFEYEEAEGEDDE